MGQVRFTSTLIPMLGPEREVLREALEAGGRSWTICAAQIGNPHCVVLVDDPTPELAREIGPLVERHLAFPKRTNVQFMRREGERAIRIEIWERGAGYTQASGSSSCAAAAVAVRLGMCASPVTVRMPGGALEVHLDPEFRARLRGPVAFVAEGQFSAEWLAAAGLLRL
jgi:diaminopimelate epimerase